MSGRSSSWGSRTRHSSAPSCFAGALPASTSTRSIAGRRPAPSWRRCARPSPGRARNTRPTPPPQSMPEFDFNGHRISYQEHGAGERPIVLIHGLLMNRRMFDRLAPEMAERGNRVIALDLLGHGRSDRPPEMVHYSMTFFARQVEALLDHLEVDQAVIGGTSLGANTSLTVAKDAPERVKAMVVEMPVLDNALLAVSGLFTPILFGLRFGEPLLKPLAE